MGSARVSPGSTQVELSATEVAFGPSWGRFGGSVGGFLVQYVLQLFHRNSSVFYICTMTSCLASQRTCMALLRQYLESRPREARPEDSSIYIYEYIYIFIFTFSIFDQHCVTSAKGHVSGVKYVTFQTHKPDFW